MAQPEGRMAGQFWTDLQSAIDATAHCRRRLNLYIALATLLGAFLGGQYLGVLADRAKKQASISTSNVYTALVMGRVHKSIGEGYYVRDRLDEQELRYGAALSFDIVDSYAQLGGSQAIVVVEVEREKGRFEETLTWNGEKLSMFEPEQVTRVR